MAEPSDGIETYMGRINAACHKNVSGKDIKACAAFLEEPHFIITYRQEVPTETVDGITRMAPPMTPPKGYAVRIRVECNDAHANPKALEQLHKDINGLVQELLRPMISDAKVRQRKIVEFTGGVQKQTSIRDIDFSQSGGGPLVTYSPYAGENGYFCEEGDNKILFYLFAPDKKVVEEMGRQLKGHDMMVLDGLSRNGIPRRL